MTTEPRRSSRRAYKSLEELQRRARAVASTEENEALWGDQAMIDDDDDDFNTDEQSDKGEVCVTSRISTFFFFFLSCPVLSCSKQKPKK